MYTVFKLSQMLSGEEFSFGFRNFLDEFYRRPSVDALREKPAGTDRNRNAYLAATTDFLCNKYGLKKPAWLGDEGLVAEPPYFSSDNWKMRVFLLADSPQEFRQRDIFVSRDALARA